MEKLIISKELADEVKKWRGNVAEGIEIVINTYDVMEDAQETAQELNNSL